MLLQLGLTPQSRWWQSHENMSATAGETRPSSVRALYGAAGNPRALFTLSSPTLLLSDVMSLFVEFSVVSERQRKESLLKKNRRHDPSWHCQRGCQ